MISNQSKWQRYRTSLLKARSVLDQATLRYAFENGENPDCGYIITNNETSHTNNTDCSSLYDFYKKALNVVKVCESNAYENGCIPEYEGIDTIYKKNNPSISDDDVIQATSGCGGWKKSSIKSGKAIVLADGMIFSPYGNFMQPLMAVDLNGQAGPNKWGVDIHSFALYEKEKYTQPKWQPLYGGCEPVESVGVYTKTLLYNKNYM